MEGAAGGCVGGGLAPGAALACVLMAAISFDGTLLVCWRARVDTCGWRGTLLKSFFPLNVWAGLFYRVCFYRYVGDCAVSDDGGEKPSDYNVCLCVCVFVASFRFDSDLTTSCKRLIWDSVKPKTEPNQKVFKFPRGRVAPLLSFDALIWASKEHLLEGPFAGGGLLACLVCCCIAQTRLD